MASLRLHALAWQVHDARLRIDLKVDSGESVVVAADPPAGTALADVVLGMRAPLSGSVQRDGDDVTARPPGRRGITLVPVGGGLLPHLTVERNIAYGGDRAHALDRVRDLQLEGVRRLRPHELSPGQRLLVAVARALCHHPAPGAIVFEDRADQVPYLPAVEVACAHGASVLVLTDRKRAARLHGALRPEEFGDAP